MLGSQSTRQRQYSVMWRDLFVDRAVLSPNWRTYCGHALIDFSFSLFLPVCRFFFYRRYFFFHHDDDDNNDEKKQWERKLPLVSAFASPDWAVLNGDCAVGCARLWGGASGHQKPAALVVVVAAAALRDVRAFLFGPFNLWSESGWSRCAGLLVVRAWRMPSNPRSHGSCRIWAASRASSSSSHSVLFHLPAGRQTPTQARGTKNSVDFFFIAILRSKLLENSHCRAQKEILRLFSSFRNACTQVVC